MTRIFSRFFALAMMMAGVGLIRADTPPAGPAASAPATEGLAVIVHKSNPVENLNLAELRKLCAAERRQWDHGRRVTIVLRDPETAERAVVLEKVYRMQENEFERFFLQETFTGKVQVAPKQLATASGVRRFVFNVPGALGFVRLSDVDGTVKVVQVDGKVPSDPAYPLQVPVK